MDPKVIHAISDLNDNPLSIIEEDISALIRTCGDYKSDLESNRVTYEDEIKKMLLEFIEVSDAFERLFINITPRLDSADKQTKIWIGNFQSVNKLLQRALKRCDVALIETVIGSEVDYTWHTIAETIDSPDKEDGTIVEVVKRGYLWGAKILKAAEVVIVKNN